MRRPGVVRPRAACSPSACGVRWYSAGGNVRPTESVSARVCVFDRLTFDQFCATVKTAIGDVAQGSLGGNQRCLGLKPHDCVACQHLANKLVHINFFEQSYVHPGAGPAHQYTATLRLCIFRHRVCLLHHHESRLYQWVFSRLQLSRRRTPISGTNVRTALATRQGQRQH